MGGAGMLPEDMGVAIMAPGGGILRSVHAFLDESRRGEWYLMAAVTIPSAEVRAMTKTVRELVPRGQYRTHLSAERPAARRRILDSFCDLAVTANIAVARYEGGDDQQARERCLEALARALSVGGVRMMVLDSRGPDRDRQDRRLLQHLHSTEGIDRNLAYTHRGSRDELLLCLPDAFAWAYGAGGPWRTRVEPQITLIATRAPGTGT